MRLWLDDLRPMPADYDIHARTYIEAVDILKTGKVVHVSLDHDLGTDETGYDVACYIEMMVYHGRIPMPTWDVHSANPPGRSRIDRALRTALARG